MPEATRDPDVVKTDQGSFDPGRAKSFLDVDECHNCVHVTAKRQRVEDAERHGIRAPTKTTLGNVQLRENVQRNVCVDKVLEDLEGAGCKGYGMRWDDEALSVGPPDKCTPSVRNKLFGCWLTTRNSHTNRFSN